jgi:hypothetical protein
MKFLHRLFPFFNLFEDDSHSIISKKGYEVLSDNDKYNQVMTQFEEFKRSGGRGDFIVEFKPSEGNPHLSSPNGFP